MIHLKKSARLRQFEFNLVERETKNTCENSFIIIRPKNVTLALIMYIQTLENF